MNHSTVISDSYYGATEQELLDDYLKAADMLSVNDDKLSLHKSLNSSPRQTPPRPLPLHPRLKFHTASRLRLDIENNSLTIGCLDKNKQQQLI